VEDEIGEPFVRSAQANRRPPLDHAGRGWLFHFLFQPLKDFPGWLYVAAVTGVVECVEKPVRLAAPRRRRHVHILRG
jgi:hypothetical protein